MYGFPNIKMLAFSQKNKGDTNDKIKRNLLTELPEELGFKLSYIPHKYILSVLKRLSYLPLYKKNLEQNYKI